jgi:hypothetical protein
MRAKLANLDASTGASAFRSRDFATRPDAEDQHGMRILDEGQYIDEGDAGMLNGAWF